MLGSKEKYKIYIIFKEKEIGYFHLNKIKYKMFLRGKLKLVLPDSNFPYFKFEEIEKDEENVYLKSEEQVKAFRTSISNYSNEYNFYPLLINLKD